MDQINEIHNRSLEWGAICNLADKISRLEEGIGPWDELADMVADAMDMESKEEDTSRIFFGLYQFMWRLFYRLRGHEEVRPFNVVTKVELQGAEYIRITNYDYKTFKWAKAGGLDKVVTNDYIDIPVDKLSTSVRRQLERRIGKEKK